MRAFLGLSLVAVLTAASCEKAKQLMAATARKDASAASSAPVPLTEIDAASYEPFTQTPGKLVVVVFVADWCGVSKEMEPVLAKTAGEFSSTAVVAKIDSERSKAFAASENVSDLPEIRFYRDGKMVQRELGQMEHEELRKAFRSHSQGLAPSTPPENSAAPAAPATPAISPMKKDWRPPGLERR
ncbi:thioredoxin family protein [Luteolibacter luteus]|uniref:Thioredoxin family protein n=1 Tax=Luteolibacter luteus TaxID=2728835 RepID=A0A858RGZ0_9BACT|nr:thioredoxin family protein [Luteolibacter luteus]QJE96426.1 thioredoxin family protein [Luteolibacter luteus]